MHVPDDLIKPPFYLPLFEEEYCYIIDVYEISPASSPFSFPVRSENRTAQAPSHKLFHKMFGEVFYDPSSYHVVIFGTCGTIPTELELMYPFAYYHYMLDNFKDPRIKDDFFRNEIRCIVGHLEKTRGTYTKHIAYCIGIFRSAMEAAVTETGILRRDLSNAAGDRRTL